MSGFLARWSRRQARLVIEATGSTEAFNRSRRRWYLRVLGALAPAFKARLDARAREAFIRRKNLLAAKMAENIRRNQKGKTCPGRYEKAIREADTMLREIRGRKPQDKEGGSR